MKESKAPSLGRTPAQKFFDKWQGLFYLIPWIIGFVVFKAIPFGQSLYYSFTDMDFFNGIHQYGTLFLSAVYDAPEALKDQKCRIHPFKKQCRRCHWRESGCRLPLLNHWPVAPVPDC